MTAFDRLARFALGPAAIPESALRTAARLLVDTVAVTAGAAGMEAGRIARDVAVDLYGAGSGGWSAPLMFDGRRASLAGAAFAGATQTDNLDAHDGYNPVKGHIGCAVIPALFAFAERRPDLGGRAALEAAVIAYEIAARAGRALHGTVEDYHTSGAWNGLGVAALGCRLLGADADQLRHALGIAEYHGPRSQMMREIATPTMLHDGSGMGALVGVSAAVMAMRGFTGAPAITVEEARVAPLWSDLGEVWTIERNYVKPYPVCRWAHAAIDAVRALQAAHGLAADDVGAVTLRVYAAAARLFPGMPATTSEAQYSLGYAVACMLQRGRVGPAEVVAPALSDPAIAAMLARIEVVEAPEFTARFPEERLSEAVIETRDGRRLASGPTHPLGGVEAPMSDAQLAAKAMDFARETMGEDGARRLIRLGADLVTPGARFAELCALTAAPRKILEPT